MASFGAAEFQFVDYNKNIYYKCHLFKIIKHYYVGMYNVCILYIQIKFCEQYSYNI